MVGIETGWVDTHFHVICRQELTYSWLDEMAEPWTGIMGDYTTLSLGDYTLDAYLAEASLTGVCKLVHVEAAFGSEPWRESALVQKLAGEHKIPIAIVGHADLNDSGIEALLDRHLENSNFRGVRMLWGMAKSDSAAFRSGFAAVARRGLSFEDPSPWQKFDGFCKTAADFPNTQIVLGHCGMPMQRDEAYLASWGAGLKRVAQHDNVFCKISGLRMTEHDWTFASVKRMMETVIEAFGCDRCFFGSNWPVDSLYAGRLESFVDNVRTIIAPYSTCEQVAMLRGNASAFYRF